MRKPGRRYTRPDLKAVGQAERNDRDRTVVPMAGDLEAVPLPPDWLSDKAADLWNDLAPILCEGGNFKKTDLRALAHLCTLDAKCEQLVRAGETPNNAMYNQLRQFYGEFGMTPMARVVKGSAAKPPGKRTKFSGLRKHA